MKTKISRFSRRSIATVLCVLMLFSTFMVGTITTAEALTGSNTVYFKNTANWSSVYVYFYSRAYDYSYDGAAHGGSQTAHGLVAGPFKMSTVWGHDEGSTIYSYTYSGTWSHIAFTEAEQKNYEHFYNTKVVPCGSGYTTTNVMCNPGSVTRTANGCSDYQNYWFSSLPTYQLHAEPQSNSGGNWSLTDQGNFTRSGVDTWYKDYSPTANFYCYITGWGATQSSGTYYKSSTDKKACTLNTGTVTLTKYAHNNNYGNLAGKVGVASGNGKVRVYWNPDTKVMSVKKYYTVTVGTHTNTTLTAGGSSTSTQVIYNESCALVATPNANYNLATFAVSGTSIIGTNTGATRAVTVNQKITSNVTVTATSVGNSYNITYKDGGNTAFSGTHESGYPQKHTYGTATTLKTASKTGYTFGGWFTSSNCSGTAVTSLGATAYTGDITLYAKWTKNNYTVTLNEPGTTGGTVKVGNTAITTGGVSIEHGTYDLSVTAPNGYNVSKVEVTGGSLATAGTTGSNTYSGTVNVTATTTITVTYEAAGTCGFDPINPNTATLNIGQTTTFTATPNGFHKTGTISAKSDNENVATVSKDGNNYTVTAVNKGTATITVECTEGGKATFTVTVNKPTITVEDKTGLKIGETYTPEPTLTNPNETGSGWTVEYSATSGSSATVNGSTITAVGTGTTQFNASFKYNGVQKASTTFSVTPVAPTATFNNYSNIGIGATATASLTNVTNADNLTKSFEVTAGSEFATVNSSNGTVTGVKPGTATVTVNYKYNNTTILSDTAEVTVDAPTVNITSANTANVNGIILLTANSSNATTTPTYTWSVADGTGKASLTGNNTLTALTPGTVTVTVNAKYNNSYTKSVNQTVTIADPTVTIEGNTVVAKGDSVTFSATSTGATPEEYTWSVENGTGEATITGDTLTAVSLGTVTVKVEAKYNNSYTKSATQKVTIEEPKLDIDGKDINNTTVYTTVNAPLTYTLSNNFSGSYSVTSEKAGVATAEVVGNTLTITPVAKGSTTIEVKASKDGVSAQSTKKAITKGKYSTGAGNITTTQTFTVKVADAETDKILYFTNGAKWGQVKAYLFGDGENKAWPGESMVKIGKNNQDQEVYAIRYPATKKYTDVIISDGTDNNKVQINDKTDISLSSGYDSGFNAIWCNKAYDNNSAGWYNANINIPQVTIDDASTQLGTDYTMTATKVNEAEVGEYQWKSADTSVATVTADTDTTPSTTVTPKDAGTSTITVKAFAKIPYDGWTLDYNNVAALPFIGSEDTATLTVTADPRTVTYSSQISKDGTTYNAPGTGENPGTVTATASDGTNVTDGSKVAHGSSVTFTATANAGYKFVGWKVNDGANEKTTNNKTIEVKADTDVKALFDKGVNVTFKDSSDFENKVLKTATFTYDEARPVAPANPEHAGYTFKGWSSDGGTTTYAAAEIPVLDNAKDDITYTATYNKIKFSVNGFVTVKLNDTGYVGGSDAVGTLAITNTDGSEIADTLALSYNDKVKIVATAKDGYRLDGIYRVKENSEEKVECATNESGTTMTCNEYTLSDLTNPAYVFEARFTKIYYITLYESFDKDANGKLTFVASAPRMVKVGDKTYTYSSSGKQGEENAPTESNYSEGNKIPVFAGEEIKLTYSGLSSSDSIRGVYFNNAIRYTTANEKSDKKYNLYLNRNPQNDSDKGESGWSTGDDDWEYTEGSDNFLFIESNQTNPANVDQDTHTVTWTAKSDYLNIDLDLGTKSQIHINNDNWDGISIEGLNTEGYYFNGETVGQTDSADKTQIPVKISLDNSDTTKRYSFTGEYKVQKKTGENTYVDVTDVEVTPSGTPVSSYTIKGKMPTYDLYITIGVKEEYNLKLANIVVADNIDEKTMLTECGSNSTTATDSIGTITAVDSKTGDDISDDSGTGNYYTYNKGAGATNNTANSVSVYNNDGYDHTNKYLNGGVNENGSMVEKGSTVTYTFTFSAEKSANYSFVGWFEGTYTKNNEYGSTYTVDYTKKLSGKTSFTFTPKKNTVVIAVGTRDIYLGGNFDSTGKLATASGDKTTWSSERIRMSFDPTYVNSDNKVGRYYYQFTDVTTDKEYQFRAYDTLTGTKDTNLTVWNQWNKDNGDYGQDNDDILFGRHKYSGQSDGAFMFKTNTNEWRLYDNTDYTNATSKKNHQANGYGNPVTVYFYAYDGGMKVESTYQWSMAYVSAGRGIAGNTPTATVANKTVNGKDVVVTPQNKKYGNTVTIDNKDVEKYEIIHECQVQEKNGQIVVTADSGSADVELEAFLVYNIETKEAEAVKEFNKNGNKYTGNITIPQNSKIYVVPIYKYIITDTNGLESHTVYVRTDEINKDNWGGLVAMYSWGSREYSGEWPGQLMIPSDDGKSFYAPLTFEKGKLSGVTFNNYDSVYMVGDTPKHTNFIGTYSIKDNNGKNVSDVQYSGKHYSPDKTYQTYDYREPISIIENLNNGVYTDEKVDLTFVLKKGNKKATGEFKRPGKGQLGSTELNSVSSFEYLTDRSGEKRVDLNGNTLNTKPTATYQIVCSYTNAYDGVTKTYDFAPNTKNEFSIDWTVYQGDTKVLDGSYLSAGFIDKYKDQMLTYIASKIIEKDLPVTGKAVQIAYEIPGNWDSVIRYSGQWYADGVNTLVDAKVRVGILSDGVYTVSDSNAPGYGKATISANTGFTPDSAKGEKLTNEFNETSTEYSMATITRINAKNSSLKFTAEPDDATFQGWYRKVVDSEGNETFEPVGSNYKSANITPSFTEDITYYAFYSAAATYQFKYIGRDGKDKTYTAKGYDLTEAELAKGGTLDATARKTDVEDKLGGIKDIKIFNRTLTYALSPEKADTSKAYTISYTAGDTENEYTLNVYSYDDSGNLALNNDNSVTGKWSTTVELPESLLSKKPSGKEVFIGWKEYVPGSGVTGDYISTNANFGYVLTENLTIAPVFGTADERKTALAGNNEWKSYIDRNVITQELYGPDSGTIYNDNLVKFQFGGDTMKMIDPANYNGKVMDLTKNSDIECGLLIVAQDEKSKAEYGTKFTEKFNDASIMQKYADYLRTNDLEVAKFNPSTFGNTAAYRVKVDSLSRLNRVHIYQALDYERFSGGNYRVMAYYYDSSSKTYKYSEVKGDTYVPTV